MPYDPSWLNNDKEHSDDFDWDSVERPEEGSQAPDLNLQAIFSLLFPSSGVLPSTMLVRVAVFMRYMCPNFFPHKTRADFANYLNVSENKIKTEQKKVKEMLLSLGIKVS